METIMTIADIQAQFPSEWVLVEDPRTNETLEVQEGKVKAHSKIGMRYIAWRHLPIPNTLRSYILVTTGKIQRLQFKQ